MKTKKEIRREILTLRETLSPADRKKGDILVTERILGHQWYYRADNLLIFLSHGTEISTKMIIEDAWRTGKTVYVPKVIGRQIQFYQIDGFEEVREGFKGILEPLGESNPYVYRKEEADGTLVLMPGVAFDDKRNRIGYGGGFYDRFLENKEELPAIAIGYSCQLTEEIPAEPYDRRPWQVICL